MTFVTLDYYTRHLRRNIIKLSVIFQLDTLYLLSQTHTVSTRNVPSLVDLFILIAFYNLIQVTQ